MPAQMIFSAREVLALVRQPDASEADVVDFDVPEIACAGARTIPGARYLGCRNTASFLRAGLWPVCALHARTNSIFVARPNILR